MKMILHTTRMSLPEKKRIELISMLNKTLASVADLQIQLKHAHWNIKGANFIALHKLFDELHEEAEEHADVVAERVMALGGTALGTIQDIVKNTGLRVLPTNIFTYIELIEHIAHNFAILSELCREHIDKSEKLDDMATNDIYIDLCRMLDKNMWFLEAHLQK